MMVRRESLTEGEEKMGIGLSGMISGLDTDSIVKAMVSGQQLKATKIENKITLNNKAKWHILRDVRERQEEQREELTTKQ